MNAGAINYFTHSSKTRCVFVDNKESPLISIDIWCKAGSSFEEFNKNGTAHFLEHMIFKGTNKIMPGEFDYKIESLGGLSNASTGYDDVHFNVLIPPINFRESLALLTNIVESPEFDINEFNKEKGVVIDEIKQQNDQPDEKLFNHFLKSVWANHNYSDPILGTEESIKILDISDLENFHSSHYVSERICIAVAGNLSKDIYSIFNESNFFSGLNKDFKLKKKSLLQSSQNKPSLLMNKGREEIRFDNLEFSRILIAWDIPGLNDQKNIIGLELLASILSNGRNSRLVKTLKEEKNIVESIFVDINAGELGGLLIIEASCEKKDLTLVEELINFKIDELINCENLTQNEIKKATNIVRSNYVYNLETSSQLSSFYGNELLWGRKNSLAKIENYLKYWSDLSNFKEVTNFISKESFKLIAFP